MICCAWRICRSELAGDRNGRLEGRTPDRLFRPSRKPLLSPTLSLALSPLLRTLAFHTPTSLQFAEQSSSANFFFGDLQAFFNVVIANPIHRQLPSRLSFTEVSGYSTCFSHESERSAVQAISHPQHLSDTRNRCQDRPNGCSTAEFHVLHHGHTPTMTVQATPHPHREIRMHSGLPALSPRRSEMSSQDSLHDFQGSNRTQETDDRAIARSG